MTARCLTPDVQLLSPQDVYAKLQRNEIRLFDVREPAEYRSECIAEATLIPLGTVVRSALPAQDKPFVVHCRSGRRSEEAAKKLLAEDPNLMIYNMDGGILAWQEAGLPLKYHGRSVLPLDRQTQIAVGALVFSGIMLGTYVNPVWYVLSGFLGVGLMFAGITGWCGMAKVLARMPWNQ